MRVQPTQNELGGMHGMVGSPDYDAEVELAGLLLTLDELGLDRPHVAGWSNGGKLALHLALAHPDRIRSLTLIEPAARWVLETAGTQTPDFAAFWEGMNALAGRDVTEDDLAAFLVSAGVVPAGVDRTTMEQLPVWAGSLPFRNALSWGGPASWGEHHVDELHAIRCPTLVVRGTETSSWLAATAALVARSIPGAVLLDLPGGHACLLQSADAFLAALGRHLDAVPV